MKAFLPVLFLILTSQNSKAEKATLTVEIPKVAVSKGDLLIAVYQSSAGFPDKPEKATALLKSKALAGLNSFTFQLNPGKYAVAVIHDVNSNGEMDVNGLGIPKEPVGFSNDPMLLGKPSYEDTNFEVVAPTTNKAIKLKSIGIRRIKK